MNDTSNLGMIGGMTSQGEIILSLNSHPKIGSQTLKKVLNVYPDAIELGHESEAGLRLKLGEKIAELVIEARKTYLPEKELERLNKQNIGYMTLYDKEYPALLKQISDNPAILYVKGDYKTE